MTTLNIQNDAKTLQMLVNALDAFITHYHEYQADMDDVILAASYSKAIQQKRDVLVDNDMEKEEQEYDVNMDPNAKVPGKRFVIGRGWV